MKFFGEDLFNMKEDLKLENFLIMFILSSWLFCNFFLPNDILALFVTTIICGYLLLCEREYVLPAIIYFSFFSLIFIVKLKYLFVFLCIAFAIRVVVEKINLRNYKSLFVWIAGFAVYFATHIISTSFDSLKLGDLIPFASLGILFFMSIIYDEKTGRGNVITAYLFGFVVSSVFGFFREETRLAYILDSDLITYNKVRFSGLAFDSNFYGILAIITLCILIFEYGYEIKNTIVWYVLFVFTIYCGLVTYSKTFFLCFFVVIIVALIKADNKIRKRFLYFIPVIIVGLIVFWSKISEFMVTMFGRFQGGGSNTLDDLTTGRFSIWLKYVSKIFASFKSFMFGNGIQYVPNLMAAHNTILEILYKFGFVGFLVDAFALYLCFFLTKAKKFENSLRSYVCIALFLFFAFSLSLYTFYSTSSILFVIIIAVKNKEVPNKTEENKEISN